jgi:hypothetical protein
MCFSIEFIELCLRLRVKMTSGAVYAYAGIIDGRDRHAGYDFSLLGCRYKAGPPPQALMYVRLALGFQGSGGLSLERLWANVTGSQVVPASTPRSARKRVSRVRC